MAEISLVRPDLATLIDRADAEIGTRLLGTNTLLRNSALGVLARVLAGGVHGLYGFQETIARQAIVSTADTAALELWADVWGLSRNPPVIATGSVQFTGTDGTIVPLGAEMQRVDGTGYASVAAVTVTGGVASIPVQARLPGSSANSVAGSTLVFTTPIVGVAGTGAVEAGGIAGGDDVETDEALRARILARIKNPPQGGSENDFVTWALSNPGVTRAWATSFEYGPGTVTVRFMMDDVRAPDGLPNTADIVLVQTFIEDPSRKPITAQLFVEAPTLQPVDVSIAGLSPDTAAIRAAIEAELSAMFRREAEPGATTFLSKINEAIALAPEVGSYSLTAPGTNVAANDRASLHSLGTVTYF